MPEIHQQAKVQRNPPPRIDPKTRRQMIEQAAYFRAVNQGFHSDPASDWLAAEAEIDRLLENRSPAETGEEEVAAFEKLRTQLHGILSRTRSVKPETFDKAMDRAAREIKKMEIFTHDSINKSVQALKKDIARNIADLEGKWDAVSEKSTGRFSFWSKKSSAFLNQAGTSAGQWLKRTGKKIRPTIYKFGEISPGGTFRCKSCGHEIKLAEPGHMVRCPECGHPEFRLKTTIQRVASKN